MSTSINNVSKKLKQLDVNPSKSPEEPEVEDSTTSYSDIAIEMQCEVVKHLDFKSRMMLKSTCSLEKMLYDAKPVHFESVKLVYRDRRSDVLFLSAELKKSQKSGRIRLKSKVNHHNTLRCAAQILGNCKIDNFEFSSVIRMRRTDLKPFWTEFAKIKPLKLKRFRSDSNDPRISNFFLRKCEFVEEILIGNRDSKDFSIFDVVRLPAVNNAKLFQFRTSRSFGPILRFSEDWLKNDVKIGKMVRMAVKPPGDMDHYARTFQDRIFSKSPEIIRISTDNPEKHILLRLEHFLTFQPTGYYSLTVIPANLSDSEYETDDTWIRDILKAETEEIDRFPDNYYDYDDSDDGGLRVPLDSEEEFYLSD